MRIRLDHVSHRYGESEEAAAVQVLDDVSLEIASGDFAVLRGASGGGKSTLLNLIGAVDRPTSGSIRIGDVETSALSERELTLLRRTQLGFVFQFFNLIPTLNAYENIAFPLSLAKVPRAQIETRVSEVLQRIGLEHRAKHYPNALSGGEMQRVAIGRAIVHRPSLILADEPTGNLDTKTGSDIINIFEELAAANQTIVLVTHDLAIAARTQRRIKIVDGAIVDGDTLDEEA